MSKKYFKNSNAQNFNAGFTLVEIVVAIFGFGMIIVGLIALFSNLFTISGQQSSLLSDSSYARKLAFQVANELRNGVTGSNGAYVLDTAGDQQIIFYSPNSDTDSGIERIRYYVQAGKLYKGITEYSGSTYNTSTEQSTIVQTNLANGANPVFYYYDGSYTGSSSQASLTQPVNVTAVKFVKISLQIYNKAGVKNTNFYTVTASAAIRNLKTNLGDAAASGSAPTNVSSRVSVTQNGFGWNHSTGIWTATMTVTNNTGTAITGPIQVVLTNLSSNATMTNNTGTYNGSPYITMTSGSLAGGGAVSSFIQFTNPSAGFINYTPVTYSGGF